MVVCVLLLGKWSWCSVERWLWCSVVESELLQMMSRAGVVCGRAVDVAVDSSVIVYIWLGRRALWHQWMRIQLMMMSLVHAAVGLKVGRKTSWWL